MSLAEQQNDIARPGKRQRPVNGLGTVGYDLVRSAGLFYGFGDLLRNGGGVLKPRVVRRQDREVRPRAAHGAHLGAAELGLRSEDDFDVLVDQVATEGGATIESIKLLKEENFEDLVVRGAQAAVDKANRMGAKK